MGWGHGLPARSSLLEQGKFLGGILNCAKTSVRIEMPFGTKTQLYPRNVLLDGVCPPPQVAFVGGAKFRGQFLIL